MTKEVNMNVSKVLEDLSSIIKKGETCFFCGAGISSDSGIPLAKTIVEEIVRSLQFTSNEADDIIKKIPLQIPFEAFIECLLDSSMDDTLLKIFELGEPTQQHYLLAGLAKMGKVKIICTTNFDTLIEKAFGDKDGYKLYYEDADLNSVNWNDPHPIIIKLHGSIDDKKNIAVTLRKVAGEKPSSNRKKVIQYLFSDGPHKRVSVMGYSCSDRFDITPQILSLAEKPKHITLIRHTEENEKNYGKVISIKAKTQLSNPFLNFKTGEQIFTDTHLIVEHIYSKYADTEIEKKIQEKKSVKWTEIIDTWLKNVKSKYGESLLSYIRGSILLKINRFEDALEYFKNAIDLVKADENPNLKLLALGSAGQVYTSLGKLSEALELHNKALQSGKENDNYAKSTQHASIANLYSSSAHQYTLLSIDQLNKAIDLNKSTGNEYFNAPCYSGLGNAYCRLGDYKTGLDFYNKALDLLDSNDDIARIAEISSNIGSAYYSMMNYKKAMKYYKRALDLAQACGDSFNISMFKINLGNTYCGKGNYKKGIKLYESAKLALTILLDENHTEIMMLNNRIKNAKEYIQTKIASEKVIA